MCCENYFYRVFVIVGVITTSLIPLIKTFVLYYLQTFICLDDTSLCLNFQRFFHW